MFFLVHCFPKPTNQQNCGPQAPLKVLLQLITICFQKKYFRTLVLSLQNLPPFFIIVSKKIFFSTLNGSIFTFKPVKKDSSNRQASTYSKLGKQLL